MNQGNCIITGGSGFIGTHLITHLLETNRFRTIYVLDIRKPQITSPAIVYIPCDIRNPIDVTIAEPCDTCYHLAALCKEPGYAWEEYFATNHVGTQNVCDWAERNGAVDMIFTSTMMVFRAGEERNAEEALAAPDTAYGISKLLAELALQKWQAKSSERRLRVVRPGVVFGKGEGANYTRLYYALNKRRFAYIGRKSTVKGSIYVKDLVRFLDFLTNDANSRITYNLVYPDPITIEDICQAMCDVFGFSARIPVIPYRLALLAGYAFEILDVLGIKTSIHHRRIQKLYYSTNVSADPAMQNGFQLMYPLSEALRDWQKDCLPQDLY